MPFVYILYSTSCNKYYIGATIGEIENRLQNHINEIYGHSFTTIAKDWIIYYSLYCKDMKQALQIEKHIKRMKSRKYIENLKAYPSISEGLLLKYISKN